MLSLRTIYLSTAALLLTVTMSGACKTVEVNSIRNKTWPAKSLKMKDIAVGHFEFQGQGFIPFNTLNFYEALSFSLVEKGFITSSHESVRKKLMENELPVNRKLSGPEILRLNSVLGGKLYLQGNIQEHMTESTLEEMYQIMINVNIHDLQTGEKLGEIKLFAKDLQYNTGRETLMLSRKIVERLELLITQPGKKF